jgi:hypothetical protein
LAGGRNVGTGGAVVGSAAVPVEVAIMLMMATVSVEVAVSGNNVVTRARAPLVIEAEWCDVVRAVGRVRIEVIVIAGCIADAYSHAGARAAGEPEGAREQRQQRQLRTRGRTSFARPQA